MSSFPVFDSPRSDPHDQRHVQHESGVTMRVDATDEWITVPLRAVFTDDGLSGWSFEIGPYSVSGPDATELANAIAHYGRVSEDFRPTGDPS
ncbi:hypothetical protein LK459_11425 [Gordonia otitidis]|uniref:hypothetical protein n=1 Tax=Gordonia otitidis TaxID=249058 RepID=UPI001D156DD9|nr:hypothetical protein [Gordonia otitidis]UEA61362.1 hypothetical protein LK459_11425 [Gordonia otitidis]